MAEPQPTEWAWLAGIIDGEGSVTAYERAKTATRRTSFHGVFLQVVNTDIEIMEKVRRIVGPRKLTISIRPGRRKPLYHLTVSGKSDIHRILTNCLPYLTGKKQRRAVLMLEYVNRRAHWGRGTGHQIDDYEIDLLRRIEATK